MTVHRSWDIGISDAVKVTWFRRNQDGSLAMLDQHMDVGRPIADYVDVVREKGIDRDSIDFVPKDAKCRSLSGPSMFEHMQTLGLNPLVLP